jgi:UDPglucose 6-dehydrogenase
VGADVQSVAKAIGMDRRIGSKFLHAGPATAARASPRTRRRCRRSRARPGSHRIVDATIAANERQMERMVDKVWQAVGRRGRARRRARLAFKPNTDDLRARPALAIIQGLKRRGVAVRCSTRWRWTGPGRSRRSRA